MEICDKGNMGIIEDLLWIYQLPNTYVCIYIAEAFFFLEVEKYMNQWMIDTCTVHPMNGWHTYCYVFTNIKYKKKMSTKISKQLMHVMSLKLIQRLTFNFLHLKKKWFYTIEFSWYTYESLFCVPKALISFALLEYNSPCHSTSFVP